MTTAPDHFERAMTIVSIIPDGKGVIQAKMGPISLYARRQFDSESAHHDLCAALNFLYREFDAVAAQERARIAKALVEFARALDESCAPAPVAGGVAATVAPDEKGGGT